MKKLVVSRLGEPNDVLRVEDSPVPVPGPGQVTVNVRAAAANFPDVLMCRGEYQERPDTPFVPGIEMCGEVVEIGSDVDTLAVGDRVIGGPARGFGAYAESTVMDAKAALLAPASLDDAEAAALYIGYQTGWFALHRRARIARGETVLVHAAAGGVGSAAVQLAAAAGGNVVAVVGSPDKVQTARQLGANVVVDRSTEDFVAAVKDATDGRGADIVFDPVGGEVYSRSTKCIAFEGRLIVVGFAGGHIQHAALNHALVKNYSILGLHWGLYRTFVPDSVHECHRALTKLANDGHIRPLVSEQVDLHGIPGALQRLADGRTTGRVVYVA